MSDYNINEDEKALEALLAAAFKLHDFDMMSDEDIEKFFNSPAQLSEELSEVADSLEISFVEELLNSQKIKSFSNKTEKLDEELELETMAMNRDKDGNDINDEIREAIERAKLKALEDDDSKESEP